MIKNVSFEVIIKILSNDYNSTFSEPVGTKKHLFLSDLGYKRCKEDKSVDIISVGILEEVL